MILGVLIVIDNLDDKQCERKIPTLDDLFASAFPDLDAAGSQPPYGTSDARKRNGNIFN